MSFQRYQLLIFYSIEKKDHKYKMINSFEKQYTLFL
jgi:hypothetical protein